MRLVSWNVNHRGKRQQIAPWIGEAIVREEPTIVVLTEYIEGSDHPQFLKSLASRGLIHSLLSERGADEGIVKKGSTAKELKGNQPLIVSRRPLSLGAIQAPDLPWLRPNTLHGFVKDLDLDVLAVRIPAYKKGDPTKRSAWQWLLSAADSLLNRKAIITGDLNTAVGDSSDLCGDCIDTLGSTWHHATPNSGHAFLHASGRDRSIDHLFVSPSFLRANARFSWDFRPRGEPISTAPGTPDHAMLVADIE